MASDDLKLLLQSLRNGCDNLQVIYNDLHDPSVQKPGWIRRCTDSIANDIKATTDDLEEWCTKSERSRQLHNDVQYRRKMDSAEWIIELSLSMQEALRKVFLPEITQDDVATILKNVDEDMVAIAKQVTEVKQLDNLTGARGCDLKLAVRQNQRNARTIEVLFQDKIRFESQDTRENSFGIIQRGCIGFERMTWFWRKIPCPAGMDRYQPGGGDRCDGILISQAMVERARAVLGMFISAWTLVCGDPDDRPSLDSMLDMPTIACVLNACGKQAYFNHFISAEIRDSALQENWDRFIARVEDAVRSTSLASEIIGQFSRVRQRHWLDGENLALECSEPLPLRQIDALRETRGRRGLVAVNEVEDVWDVSKHYALKVVSTETARPKQLQDLMNEIKLLTQIGKEKHGHHIVELVKTYQRGGTETEVGMLLLPVAKFDLNKFLNTCCEDPAFRNANKTYLLQAFGCISYSLAYLHNVRDMRHRDLKPGNILVHYPRDQASPNFLLADFGLAFVFREQGFSGDEDPDFGATPEYEAPEIDRSEGSVHTRTADVFALGCTFVEMVWVLTMKESQKAFRIRLRERFWNNAECKYYKHHLPALNTWIDDTHSRLKQAGDKTLCKVLTLAQGMIKADDEARPKIGDIVKELWSSRNPDANKKVFCESCIQKMKVDLGRTPQHPKIFIHTPSARENLRRGATRPRPIGSLGRSLSLTP